jgi:hypothetical protein
VASFGWRLLAHGRLVQRGLPILGGLHHRYSVAPIEGSVAKMKFLRPTGPHRSTIAIEHRPTANIRD